MFTEEQLLIQKTARDFAQDRLLPGTKAREAAGEIEPEILRELAELGFLGINTDPDWDGVGADYISYVLAMIEIAAGDGAVSTMLSVHNSLFLSILDRYGTQEQKENWMRPAACGDVVGCFALTEAHAGSDASALKTRAENRGDHYLVNGEKQFITSGKISGAAIFFAVTNPELGKKGLSAFYVPKGIDGFSVGKPEKKLGQGASDTCTLYFTDMNLPIDHRIGEEGDGYGIALSSLEQGRLGIAAQAVGMAQAAFEYALAYSQERVTFGKTIFNHQAVQFRLADMETKLEAARQLVINAARIKDSGASCLREACMAKLFASEAAEEICSGAIQTFGGNGYLEDYPVEKIYRDVRICQIYEGTSDIQKIIISRQMNTGK